MYTARSGLILIVDDTPTNLEVLSESLSDAGFDVSVATRGESAIKQAEYDPPDLILLDVMMPGINGFETCKLLKENPKTEGIPIIFMTALSDTLDKVQGLSLGAVDYITKPFQLEEVLARVQLHIKLKSLSKTLEEQNTQLLHEIEERKSVEVTLHHLAQELERRVEERTSELTQALDNLKHMQTQLVHGEKLATLGQLVAGVAHEINNPVNFIYGNIEHANEYVQDLLELLCLYQKHFSSAPPEIKEKIEEIDLIFLYQDLPQIFSSMRVGADRIRGIVQSLRIFSRHDEAEIKLVDIHEGIDSTLMILNSRMKAKPGYSSVEIIKDYGNLPQIECYAGQLNQVLMNLVSNALDALHDQEEEQLLLNKLTSEIDQKLRKVVTISTQLFDENWVSISIKDNGPGIGEHIKARIFEPFFTTKLAGRGTGLGLSISHQIIVEKHGGRLKCISQPGQGSEFVVEIPVKLNSLLKYNAEENIKIKA